MEELKERNKIETELVVFVPFLLATACVGFLATYLVLGGTSWLGLVLLAAAVGMGAGTVHFVILARSQPYQEEYSLSGSATISASKDSDLESSALRDLLLKD